MTYIVWCIKIDQTQRGIGQAVILKLVWIHVIIIHQLMVHRHKLSPKNLRRRLREARGDFDLNFSILYHILGNEVVV